MDSSAASIHHFNLLLIHLPTLQHYIPRTLPALPLDIHYKVRKAQTITTPTLIASNLWLLTSAPSTVMTEITLVCTEGPTKLFTL